MKGAFIMDNQEYQNNNHAYGTQQSTSHYQGTENNPYQQPTGGAYQQNYGYQQNGGQNQQNYGYGQNAGANQQYQGQNFTMYREVKPPKKKKEKKPHGFGRKMAECVALALVFGLVAGGVMTGVNYASGKVLGTAGSQEVANEVPSLNVADDDSMQTTATSNTYAATDISDIVNEVMPSIVAITNISETEYQSFWGAMPQTYESTSCGSGIIVSKDDTYLYIATNNHVVEGAKTLTVTFADEASVSAEIKGTDPSTDLAVVKVELNNIESATMDAIKIATLGDSDALRVGEASIAIGNALGYGQSVTTGVISAVNREVSVSDSNGSTSYTAELIQTDAAINPGNSGGALLNATGEVIGINSVKYSDTAVEGIGYAIPINTAAPIIEELITREKVDEANSAYLGISGVDVTDDATEIYNMPTGVFVVQVMENSAAAQAGILKGDIIIEFDGKKITSMDSLSSTLQYYAAGTTVDVTVLRASNGEYQEQTIPVTLGSKRS